MSIRRLGKPGLYKEVLKTMLTILLEKNSWLGGLARLSHDAIGNQDPSF